MRTARILAPLCFGLTTLITAGGATAEPAVDYERTLTSSDTVKLRDGIELDDADPRYCEKQRDLCLMLECGGSDRAHVNDACLERCTGSFYQRCKDGRGG